MILNDFMNENFPNLQLCPPLLYSWKVGIRFELGVNYSSDYAYKNSPYLQGVYNRAIALFKSLHFDNDDIYIIVDVNDYADGFKYRPKIFSRYIKEKSVLYKLNQKTIPYIFPEDDEEGMYKTYRITLKCKTSDFKYFILVKAICNQDMGKKPSIFYSVNS